VCQKQGLLEGGQSWGWPVKPATSKGRRSIERNSVEVLTEVSSGTDVWGIPSTNTKTGNNYYITGFNREAEELVMNVPLDNRATGARINAFRITLCDVLVGI